MSQSNRSANRYSLYDNLTICYEGFTEDIAVHVPNLSISGMFINTPPDFPEGAVLRVNFVLPRTKVQISARAEVRYRLSGVGIGIEFIDLEDAQQKAIDRELSGRNENLQTNLEPCALAVNL